MILRVDLTGQRFGKLLVKSSAGQNKRGKTVWRCKCDCGNESIVTTTNLNTGHTLSCGCSKLLSKLIGKRFGRLIVLHRVGSHKGRTTWQCLCDCGQEIILNSKALTSGRNKSCGCIRRLPDLNNQRFGRLVAIKHIGQAPDGHNMWLCICDCKKSTKVNATNLISGTTKSCGCLRREKARTNQLTHAKSKSKEYKIWQAMKQRCNNPNYREWDYYGGRGISVCEQWNSSFEKFFEDMGSCPGEEYSLDRISNDLGYSPENCRWATGIEQNRNTRRNVLLTYNGETKTVAEWSVTSGISARCIYDRVKWGWDANRIFTTPVKTPRKTEKQTSKRNNHSITFNGKTKSLTEWSNETGVPSYLIQVRIKKLGWSLEKALFTPVKPRRDSL